MSHPLLTKVLDETYRKAYGGTGVGLPFHEAIPPAIANAMERALDSCQYLMADPAGGPPFRCGLREVAHGVGFLDSHAYVPLVQP